MGFHMWNGTEYPKIMQTVDKTPTPYMSGPAYMLSAALAKAIYVDNGVDTSMWMQYGSSSEDMTMGKYVARTAATHPSLAVERRVDGDLCCALHVARNGDLPRGMDRLCRDASGLQVTAE